MFSALLFEILLLWSYDVHRSAIRDQSRTYHQTDAL